MPKYTVVQQDGNRFVPIRYRNFAALGAAVEPREPWALIPLFGDISEAVADAHELQAKLDRELASAGVGGRSAPDAGRSASLPNADASKPASPAVDYRDKLNFPFRFFRGERSLRFNIMATRYRFAGEPDPLATTRERMRVELDCAERIRTYLAGHGAPNASLEQARAAARHYGAPSSFVDFSFSVDVAAHFAHPAFTPAEREGGAELGILYSLGIDDFERLFGLAAWGIPPDGGRDIHYLNVARVWRIPYLSFDPEAQAIGTSTLVVPVPEHLVAKPISIRTRIVDAIPRVAAQHGIFLDFALEDAEDWWAQVFLWTVLDFASRKWCFIRKDFGYENPAAGVTTTALFPADDPALADIVEAVRARIASS